MIGPVANPTTADAIRGRLSAALRAPNGAGWRVRLSAGHTHWDTFTEEEVEDFVAGSVIEVECGPAEMVSLMASDPLGDVAYRFVLSGDYLGVLYSHALGDLGMSGPLLELALTDTIAIPEAPRLARSPLLRILPRSGVAKLWRSIPTLLEYRNSRSPVFDSLPLLTPNSTQVTALRWGQAESERWKKEADQLGVSWTTHVTCQLIDAIQTWLPVGTPVMLPIDSRRYMRNSSRVRGNYSFALRLGTVGVDAFEAGDLQAQVRRYLGAGLPALMQAVHAFLNRKPVPVADRTAAHATASVTTSVIRRTDLLHLLDTRDGCDPVDLITRGSHPPTGLLVYVVGVQNSVTALFLDHTNVFHRKMLLKALSMNMPGAEVLA
ncbi:hypothetical protein [Rhodococcoides fascians]|uniref:hypothetical protein n=1 Tax=Rhodococcoides fascians TaxID=1828 RepID=UPI000BCDDC94|nr:MULTISPECIES: hypothetical protein [Rhodococcus]OZD10788.1 hypothetical protein CH280_21270 [Rhodococcus sp. 06-156-4C]